MGMGKDDEVLPDSQDEGELYASDLHYFSPSHERHPLANTSIPSLGTSLSFVLPRDMPANHIPPSTISQYPADTVLNTVPDLPSVTSAFTASSAKPSAKSRPKPKPNYGVTIEADEATEPDSNGVVNQRSQVLPPPESTFAADISERIKVRRALARQKDKGMEHKVHAGSINSPFVAEDLTQNTPAKERRSGLSPLPSLPNHPGKQTSKPQDAASVNGDALTYGPLSLPEEVESGRDTSHTFSRKRKCDSALDNNSFMPPVFVAVEMADNLGSGNVRAAVPPPEKKKKQKIIEDRIEKPTLSEKVNKKKRKDNVQRPKKSQSKPSEKEKEQDQFKSSEFILDSDDELTIGNSKGANDGVIVNAAGFPAAVTILSSPLSESPRSFSEVQGESIQEPVRGPDLGTGPLQSVKQRSKKAVKKKRKSKVESFKGATIAETEGQPPFKKARAFEDTAESYGVQEKTEATTSIGSEIQATTEPTEPRPHMSETENDILKTRRKRGGRKIIEEDEDEGSAKENPIPLPKPPSIITPVRDTKASQRTNTSKASSHPPKNRPLSTILQLVNGSSPRPRASPSTSRSLLTRIVPLHQNRRTPPPPPPPRVIPKKTKKELEREERWEEELQETVEGWCGLDEAERGRMRRAKRDLELGLYEE